ncbi:MAG TPA: hypothetical protein VM553_00365 [Dongiaceae bacterium]|nr:hypothetical protein [Dongiaceae bacterium]
MSLSIAYSQPQQDQPNIIPVTTTGLYQQVLQLREKVYRPLYPGIKNIAAADPFDFGARLWVTLDPHGCVDSTARLAPDGDAGLPSEAYAGPYLDALRDNGLHIAEFGRLMSDQDHAPTGLSRHYYGHAWAESLRAGIDTIVIVANQNMLSLYGPCFGARLLCPDIQEDFGSGTPFSLYDWDVRNTAPAFFTWARMDKNAQSHQPPQPQ